MDVITARFASARQSLADHGVKARLCPDTQTMQFVAKGLPEWLTAHLEDCRGAYTEALRHAAGLCIRCGLDPARHPNQGGRRQVFGDDGMAVLVPSKRLSKLFGFNEAVWEEVVAAPGSWPLLWCAACYDRGAWENWVMGAPIKGGPKGAGSKTERKRAEDDKLFDGIGDDGADEESLFTSESAAPE